MDAADDAPPPVPLGAARFDPSRYPGERPAGPVVVHDGAVHPIRTDGALPSPLRGPDVPILTAQAELRWSVAYGSNAAPLRLMDKGLDRLGAVLLPARLAGWRPAFEARRTGYGAVALTLVPVTDAVMETWLLGLLPDDLDELDRTEGRVPSDRPDRGEPIRDTTRHAPPGTYHLGHVGEVAVAGRFAVPDALAYLPGAATAVQLDRGGWRTWPESDQAAAVAGLDGPSAPAPAVPEPVVGSWPRTPLRQLPLFVYGSLQPGEAAFGSIVDDVEVVGAASATGRLWDTDEGWPAARFDQDGTVHGTLLTARAADRAPDLLDRLDAYEGVPSLFRREVVRVTTSAGRRWALAYGWANGRPPGAALEDGRWPLRLSDR